MPVELSQRVLLEGWIDYYGGAIPFISPNTLRMPERVSYANHPARPSAQNLAVEGATPPDSSYVRLEGILLGFTLTATTWQPSRPPLEPAQVSEYRKLVDQVSIFVKTHEYGSSTSQAAMDQFIDRTSQAPSTIAVRAIVVGDDTALVVITTDVRQVVCAAKARSLSSRVIARQARWSVSDITNAEALISTLKDESIIAVSGGTTSYGDYGMFVELVREDPEFTNAIRSLPDGLIRTTSWLTKC